MSTRVMWKGKLGEPIKILQGTRQGGIGSTQDFKIEMKDSTENVHNHQAGCKFNEIDVSIITCADDVVIASNKLDDMLELIGLMNNMVNKERMIIHPQKSTVSILGEKKEVAKIKEEQPFVINQKPLTIQQNFIQLGVKHDFETAAITNTTIEERLESGRKTLYSLMGCGLHGVNGINPEVSWHMYEIFVQPKVIFSLEMLNIGVTNVKKLETSCRKILRQIQSLPDRVATSALHILLGCLPLEAVIDQRRLTSIVSMLQNPLLLEIMLRQISVKSRSSKSWVITSEKLLRKYKLPSIIEVYEQQTAKERWKIEVKKKIQSYWKEKIEGDASSKTSLKFLNCNFKCQTHYVWSWSEGNEFEVRKAIIQAKLLTGTYTLQYNRAAFNQTTDRTCPLCKVETEDTTHFVSSCTFLEEIRRPLIAKLFMKIPLVLQYHPTNITWSDEMLTQLILDPSHPDVVDILPLNSFHIDEICKISRQLCFTLHKERAEALGYSI